MTNSQIVEEGIVKLTSGYSENRVVDFVLQNVGDNDNRAETIIELIFENN